MGAADFIKPLTPALEERIRRNPSLNIDTFIIPSPYIKDAELEKDYHHSYVWDEGGELLGYILIYANPDRSVFQVYKQITSPFGRGKGIGSAFIHRLAASVDPEALVYLYIWEKQTGSINFFANKGFVTEDTIVYRNLTFNYMAARAGDIRHSGRNEPPRPLISEELGKTRHDARKTLRLLSDMVDMLSLYNCNKIIEDINRETTAMVNMLNAYRDTVEYLHGVNVKNLLIERILPFIEMSGMACEVRLTVKNRISEAHAHYLDVGRALVNLASNALDAIREGGRAGVIRIGLQERGEFIVLTFSDNGVGMAPERLERGADGLPHFVGYTTKHEQGQGIGTKQIYAAFGAENISLQSSPGKGTTWTIRMRKTPGGDFLALRALEDRFREFHELTEEPARDKRHERPVLAALIWRTRKLEILGWDLVQQYAKYNNIREIYRFVLAYRFGLYDEQTLAARLRACRIDHPEIGDWLLELLRMQRRDEQFLNGSADIEDYGAIMLKSCGQAEKRTVIFTMDPDTGAFIAADRKLAEHVDFVVYLGRPRDELLRGELSGDLNDAERPLTLGVWSIASEEEALARIALMRTGARTLIRLGIKKEKRIGFYQTTYVPAGLDLNSYVTTSLAELAETTDSRLERYLTRRDDDIPSFIVTD